MDPYAVLGVRPGSGNKEIAAAYREAAKRWHPDLAGGDQAAARMAEINAASSPPARSGCQRLAASR